MTLRRLRLTGLVGALVVAALGFMGTAAAAAPPTPGIELDRGKGRCTAGFAAQDDDGNYYLLTSGHCDPHDNSEWTYDDVPIGRIIASENEGDKKDAAIIRLDPGVGEPAGAVGGKYPVRDVLSLSQIRVGMPFCKLGAVTGETCGVVKSVAGGVVEASVFSLDGDSGSPGFVKNADGTVSAVGLLKSSPDGDDYTTYFTLVEPVLGKWGLQILS
ncbi:MAG: S1 family peptidase [Mycobacterium sp.]|nr:S1 family peptidase [Mycobacterium sp.]